MGILDWLFSRVLGRANGREVGGDTPEKGTAMGFYIRDPRDLSKIMALCQEVKEEQGKQSHFLHQLKHLMENVMSTIGDFGTAMNAYFDEQATAIDGVRSGVEGLAADIAFLKSEIERLNNNPGPISKEDQAILDGLLARAGTASESAKTVAAAVKELDEKTPPVIPPEVTNG